MAKTQCVYIAQYGCHNSPVSGRPSCYSRPPSAAAVSAGVRAWTQGRSGWTTWPRSPPSARPPAAPSPPAAAPCPGSPHAAPVVGWYIRHQSYVHWANQAPLSHLHNFLPAEYTWCMAARSHVWKFDYRPLLNSFMGYITNYGKVDCW